jgi:NADH-quinone oxidoreductase subunit N
MIELTPAIPEIVLACGAMLMLMFGVFMGERSSRFVNSWCVLVLVAAAVGLIAVPVGQHALFSGSFVLDDFARFLKMLTLIGSAGALVLSLDWLAAERQQRFEYGALFLLSTLGMLVLISAADLIALYLGLEMMSLALYVVAASNRDNIKSTEAGLKYFVLGALSSGMLLYGASLIYGFTGTIEFAGIARATDTGASIGLIFGLVFLFVGFCFKISAVPFHMWTPDVYEGAPTPVTAFFAAAPKVAGIAIFVRAAITAFPGIVNEWQQIVVFVAIASMALGSFAAIGQRNIKRLMAYSSIGHMGFALVGLAAGTSAGVQGVLVYMAIYVAMTLGSFAVILSMRRGGVFVENISDLAGLAHASDDGVLLRDADVLTRRHSAARRLFCEILRVPRRDQCRPLRSGRHRRADQRRRRVLLFDDREDDVFRRAGAELRHHAGPAAARARRRWRR